MCVCHCTQLLYTTNTAQNSSGNFHSHPSDNHHNSDDVYCRGGVSLDTTAPSPPSKKSLLKYTSVTTDDAAYLLDIAVIDADPHSSLGMIQERRVVCAIVVQDSNKIQRRSMNRLLWHFIKQLSSTTAKLCLVSLAFSVVTPGDVVLLEMWTKLE